VIGVRILTQGRAADYGPSATEEPEDWVTALRSVGAVQDAALRRLHGLMVAAARRRVWQMRSMLPGAGAERFDELANSAADDALAALLGKLDSFEGRSRFTTWAYKFAILQASVEVRRQAWAGREIELEAVGIRVDAGPSPAEQAEAADLVVAVGVALDVALTPYQRRIAVALLIDHVPIDVLAERLGTSRGALYKTLHQARTRLRAHLTASGHLEPTTAGTS
jgi:RNA polymerase sigma-70 factor, ECF subfamily